MKNQKNFTFGIKNDSIFSKNLQQLKEQIQQIEKSEKVFKERHNISISHQNDDFHNNSQQDLSSLRGEKEGLTQESIDLGFIDADTKNPMISKILMKNSKCLMQKQNEIIQLKQNTEKIIKNIEKIQTQEQKDFDKRIKVLEQKLADQQNQAKIEYQNKLDQIKVQFEKEVQKEKEKMEKNVWIKAEAYSNIQNNSEKKRQASQEDQFHNSHHNNSVSQYNSFIGDSSSKPNSFRIPLGSFNASKLNKATPQINKNSSFIKQTIQAPSFQNQSFQQQQHVSSKVVDISFSSESDDEENKNSIHLKRLQQYKQNNSYLKNNAYNIPNNHLVNSSANYKKRSQSILTELYR